jgi:hypothetical protein
MPENPSFPIFSHVFPCFPTDLSGLPGDSLGMSQGSHVAAPVPAAAASQCQVELAPSPRDTVEETFVVLIYHLVVTNIAMENPL